MRILMSLLLLSGLVSQTALPLSDAIMDGDLKAATALIGRGADVNEKEGEGTTPLMPPASAGRIELVRLLLASKAEVDLRNSAGATPLTAASFGGYTNVVEA